MRKVLTWSISVLITCLVVTGIIFLLIRLTPKPPVGDMDYARIKLAEAEKSRAGTYSKKLFSEAKSAYDSAMEAWRRENDKFIYFRDYEKVAALAKISSEKSKQAAKSSVSTSNNLKTKLRERIDTLRNIQSLIDSLFGRYPLPGEIRTRISKGNMLLKEGEVAFSHGQYLQANRKVNDAEYLLTGVYENASEELRNYFKSYPLWQKWAQSAINESKRNSSYSIIVDKFSKKCFVYLAGVKKYEFDAELGRNWVGDKHKMGDKATPEGRYKIVRKYQGRETPYYKALSIDYPNAEDKESFRQEIAKGVLPASAKIGGGIEIHGGGGKGVDWTEGCVALTNKEIDIVYSLVSVGTPVTIVGSLKDIDKILMN
jgi:hypothetical protein